MRQPLADKQLPSERFPSGATVDAKRLQAYHESNLLEHSAKTEAINAATVFDLGEKGADFDVDDIVTRYPEGQQLGFSYNGEVYRGEIRNGELYAWVCTRARDL